MESTAQETKTETEATQEPAKRRIAKPEYCPTPAQIARECEAIRRGWDSGEVKRRRTRS